MLKRNLTMRELIFDTVAKRLLRTEVHNCRAPDTTQRRRVTTQTGNGRRCSEVCP